LKFQSEIAPDLQLNFQKWETFYQKDLLEGNYLKERKKFRQKFLGDLEQQLSESQKFKSSHNFLEIGCGYFFMGEAIAKKVGLIIGIDFCLNALKIAQKNFESRGIKNYLLIQGDILNMPLKADVIDLVYGLGVIEHFPNTQKCLEELYRIVKKNGISFNTVPALNLGALTYRQIWGNIPNLPLLKQLAKFTHLRILKGKHMLFGYELSFLKSTLKRAHQKAGFRQVKIDKLKIALSFDFIHHEKLKKFFNQIANKSSLFWPMVKVVAQK